MKTIPVHQIKDDGLTIDLNEKEEWVLEVLKNIFATDTVDLASIKGQIVLTKYNDVIDCNGQITFTHHPPCARCGIDLTQNENITFHTNLAPLTPEKQKALLAKNDQDEAELTDDDLDFSFYTNDEIQLDPILNDEIALTIPYNYYCQTKTPCKPQLPNDPHITFNDTSDIRLAKLKDLKIPRK